MSTAVNRETSMPGGEGREVVHPDGSLTRVAAGAITTLAAGDSPLDDDGSSGVVRLSQGALWHQPDVEASAGQSFAVEIGSARILTTDATFAVIVEPDGTCFLTALVGSVDVHGSGSPFSVAPLEAAIVSPTGVLLDSVQATPEEVRSDPWVSTNLTLSQIDPAAVRVPEYVPPRFEPRPIPTKPTPDAEEPAADAVVEDAAPVVPPIVEPGPIVEPPPVDEPAPISEPGRTGSGWVIVEPVVAEPEVGEPEIAEPETEPEAEAVEEQPAATAPDEDGDEDEAQEDELDEESSRLRMGIAALLVVVGLVVVFIAFKGLLSGGESSNLASTDTPTSAAAPGASTRSTTPGGGPATTTGPTRSPSSTTLQGGGRYTVHPTRCAQTGSQLTAEGNLTNLDAGVHSYKVTVVFTTQDPSGAVKQAASATVNVANVAPNKPATWKATTTYSDDLSANGGGCKVGNVEIVEPK